METGVNVEKTGMLVAVFRRNINGAVAESMDDRGICYRRNWGVSLPVIRRTAEAFAPDHELARFLYGQELRELRLASFIIADPAAVTCGELGFWGAGIDNVELAENLAFSLLSRTGLAKPLLEEWLGGGAPHLLEYAALLALGKMADRNLVALPTDSIRDAAEKYASGGGVLAGTAAANLLLKLDSVDGI